MLTHPTPYPEVNRVLVRLCTEVQTALGDRFSGLYLYGSLASGDFDPVTSDVDFLAVTAGGLSAAEVAALEAMHTGIANSGLKWAAKLEGSYLPQDALRRYDPADPAPRPTLNEGRFYLAPHGWDWVIQRHILREQGVVVAGPPLRPRIDPVRPNELRQAVRELLRTWWAPMIQDPTWLQTSAYQVYAVLSMCRALHTLRCGVIASKPAAARWAQEALGEPWAGLIARSLAWREGDPFDEMMEVIGMIQYTAEFY